MSMIICLRIFRRIQGDLYLLAVILVERTEKSCAKLAYSTLIIKCGSLELNGNTGRIETIASQAKADKDFLATDESKNSRDALSQ